MPADAFPAWELDLHGHRVVYRMAGSGPPVVLVHGMLNASRHWEAVALRLAERHTVIAPDLIGHGDSATPRGDYSLGAHASVVRDLLVALGIERASLVGHSLGGGIAMVFFWQFPERVERLALVSSGGLGEEVSPLLRSAALPGAGALLAAMAHPAVTGTLDRGGRGLRRMHRPVGVQLEAIARALRPLGTPGARAAFLQTLRAVIDARGQRVNAADRLYLLEDVPTLVVWGERDRTIPGTHARALLDAVPTARSVVLPRAAHFPHLEQPDALADALLTFLGRTAPAALDEAGYRALLRGASPEAAPRPRPRAVA